VEGVTRLGCEIGMPKLVLTDQDSGIVKMLKEAEVNMKDINLILFKEKGINFKVCPVSGHNYHGLVERKIRTVQECLDKVDIASMRLHATGLQTLVKLIENDMNNLPIGFSYGRDSENSPLLKLVFPNMLRTGRQNSRALDGPIRMPKGPGELMKRVEQGYEVFFKLWNVTMVPRLMKMNKWFNTNAQLKVGDIVYFKKEENELSNSWTVGMISEVVKGKDGAVRRAVLRYQNFSEDQPRFTDRAARSLIKLFHIDDESWQSDMNEVEKMIEAAQSEENSDLTPAYKMSHSGVGLRYRLTATGGNDWVKREVGVQYRPDAKFAREKLLGQCKECCCVSHCAVAGHGRHDVLPDVEGLDDDKQVEFPGIFDRSWDQFEDHEVEMFDDLPSQDRFIEMLCAVNTDLGGEDDESSCPATY